VGVSLGVRRDRGPLVGAIGVPSIWVFGLVEVGQRLIVGGCRTSNSNADKTNISDIDFN
jgi:hypothetical protein